MYKKKKLNMGGNPGASLVNSLAIESIMSLINTLGSKDPTDNAFRMSEDTNPYMNLGGLIPAGFIQHNSPTHGKGGQSIDNFGHPTGKNPSAEVEKDENIYNQYAYSPNLKNEKTGNRFNIDMKKIIKKYTKDNKNPDTDEITKSGLNSEADRLAVQNETQKIEEQEGVELKDGGWISNKISKLTDEGYDHDQAVAIAINMAKEKAHGGKLPKKANGGGIPIDFNTINDIISTISGAQQAGKDITDPSRYDYSNNAFSTEPSYTQPQMSDLVEGVKGALSSATQTGQAASKAGGENLGSNDLGINVSDALRGTVLTSDLIDALKPAEQETPILPDYNEADRQYGNMRADLTQSRQEALGATNALNRTINQGSPSQGVRMARLAGSTSRLQDQLGKIGQTEQSLKNRISAIRGQHETRKARDIANRLYQTRVDNLQNQAVKHQAKERFMDDLLNVSQDLDRRKVAKMTSAELASLLGLKYANFSPVDMNQFQKLQRQYSKGDISLDQFQNRIINFETYKEE